MKSSVSNSNEKIKKATELIWKFWWFCFYLIIVPSIISLMGYFLFLFFTKDIYIVMGLSILVFMFSLLFFYKTFDKYRKTPFFKNKQNNLNARINILFQITILSLIITPIFILITPKDYTFNLLPLISFCVLYNIVWFYYYYQPIDIYSPTDKEFKQKFYVKTSFKQYHNLIIVANYIIHILFLSVLYYIEISWLFVLITNLIFYLITLILTKNQRKKIKNAFWDRKPIFEDLIIFHRKFVKSIQSLIFSILIQIPIILIFIPLPEIEYTTLLLISFVCLIILFILFYLKTRFYIIFYYDSKLEKTIRTQEFIKPKGNFVEKKIKYQRYNTILSGFLIITIIIYSFLIHFPSLVLIILPSIFILSYYELKAEYIYKEYNKFIYLTNTIAILATISFGILPLISAIFQINIQLIVFFLIFYFVLEIFVKFKYFTKESIRMAQNFLAVTSFFLIAYLFYPLIFLEYITFTSNPNLILLSAVLLNLIIFLIVLLVSFYRFYYIFKDKDSLKSFKICIFFNIFLIEVMLIILINIRTYFLLAFSVFLNILILSTVLVPALSLLFLLINYLLKVYSKESFLNYSYYVLWILTITIFFSLIFIFYHFFIILLLGLLILSIFINYQLKLGKEIQRLKEITFDRLIKINSLFIVCVLFSIFFTTFYFIIFYDFLLLTNLILSGFLSLVIACFLINIYARMNKYISKEVSLRINIITLSYCTFITFYFLLVLTLGTLFVFVLPLLFSLVFIYILIYYLSKNKIYPIFMKKILIVNKLLISLLLLLIPSFICAELVRLGILIGLSIFNLIFIIISTINLTLGVLFSILIFTYSISKKEHDKALILKSFALIWIIISFTIVFFYPFYFLYGTFYSVLIPTILASLSLYFPLVYSYKKGIVKSNLLKRLAFFDILILAFSIMTIPTIIGLELLRLGINIDVLFIILSTLVLFFGFLKFLDFNTKKIQIRDIYYLNLKKLEIFIWFTITILTFIEFMVYIFILPTTQLTIFLINVACFAFFVLNIYTLTLINDLKKNISKDRDLLLKHLKLYIFYEYLQNLIFFGIIISLSLFLTYIFQIYYFLTNISPDPVFFRIIWYFSFLFAFTLMFLVISESLIKYRLSKYSVHLELFSWIFLKLSICFTLAIFLFPFSLINKVCVFFLVFSLLTPISFYFSKKVKLWITKYELILKRVITYMFLFSMIIFYIESFLFFAYTKSIPLFYENSFFLISLLIGNIYLLSNFAVSNLRKKLEEYSLFTIYYYYGLVGILFFSLLYFNPIISLFLLGLSYLIVLYYRNYNLVYRFPLYFFLSYVTFISVYVYLDTYAILQAIIEIPLGFYIIVYLTSVLAVLFFSALLNFGKNNNFEKILLFLLMAFWSFIYVLTYTNVLIVYNITFSLFIFLFFMGINLYYLKVDHYKWFIRPCILLFIFDLTSWISYSFLFLNVDFYSLNPTLTFTLTASVACFAFIILYNKSSETFREKSFFIALPSLIIYFSVFIYFYLISYFPLIIDPLIAGIIAINFGIFLFYLSIALYQWNLSWTIWKSGWYAWNLLPVVNFIVIYNVVSEINVLINAINILGDYDVLIISIILCVLLWLPALYQFVKDYFFQVLVFVWGCSWFLVYYVSLNVFIGEKPLADTFSIIFSMISIMPLIYLKRYWKILSLAWLFLGVINILFFWFFLQSIGIKNFGILISISILIFGLFYHVYSFFPNIRKRRYFTLLCSYSMVLVGIFLTIFTILFSIIFHIWISINISCIVIASTLFTSKYMKLNTIMVNYLASCIFILNISLLTFNTFSLIPGMLLFAIFSAITVFGGSFFVFNHYNIIGPINKGIPWITMAFGVSASITSLFIIFLQISVFLICAIFSSMFLVFLYFILDEYKFLIFYLIPIPLAFISLNLIPVSDMVQYISVLILMGILIYFIYFQVLINFTNYYLNNLENRESIHLFKIYKNIEKVKLSNLICFLINTTCVSLIISIIIPLSLSNQISLFFIIWPILMLISLKYYNYLKLNLNYPKFDIYLSIISLFLYFSIPISIVINFSLSFIALKMDLVNMISISVIIFNGILFFEVIIIDRRFFKFLSNLSYKYLVLFSWALLCNISCYLFFLLHLNTYLFILTLVLSNLITNYFLKQIDIKRTEEYSKIRILLIYIASIVLSFYIASAISDIIIFTYKPLIGLPSTLLFYLNSFLILFILSYFFNKNMNANLKNWIEFILLLAIQGFLCAVYGLLVFVLLNALNSFTIFLIILIETLLSYISVKYFGKIFIKEKLPRFLSIMFSLLTFFVYIEISLLFFGLYFNIFGFFGSFLISQIILFLLTISDLYVIKRLNKTTVYLIHTISYLIISVLTFVILAPTFNFELTTFSLFLYVSMQFYTNFSFFVFLKNFNSNKKEYYEKIEDKIKNVIGAISYIFLIVFINSTIIYFPIEFQFLILSAIVHGLMIIDNIFLKFLGILREYVKFFSWISIMIFSSLYLYWIFSSFFFTFLITVTPLIILIFVLEFTYLTKLLDFVHLIRNNNEKIKKLLIFILYINFMTWPLYFASFNIVITINLFLLSTIIMWFLTYIDGQLKVIREEFRLNLRKISFLLVGTLISLDIFVLSTPYFVLFLNISISCLIFLIFAALVIKPFKKHSILAAAYWYVFMAFFSIIIYYIFLSLPISLFLFAITIILYWFIIGLEQLRRIFNKFIDYLIKSFRKIESAIVTMMNNIMDILKKYYRYVWIISSVFIALIFASLMSPHLYTINLIVSTLAIFGLSYSILPYKEFEDPDKMFSRKMTRLIIIWGSVIGIIFIFIPFEFLSLLIFISLLILGAIILPYIYYKEKKENISIKWRFYTTLFFIIILIITGILMYLQFLD